MGQLAQGLLAHRRLRSTTASPTQRLLGQPGPEGIRRTLPSLPGMLSEPPDADPHVRWCGGRRGKPGAYPILDPGGRIRTGMSPLDRRVLYQLRYPRVVHEVYPRSSAAARWPTTTGSDGTWLG